MSARDEDGHALHRDPLTGRMTVVAPGRERRPHVGSGATREAAASPCPFCPGNESLLPAVLDERSAPPGSPGPWGVRVVPNRFPVVSPGQGAERSREMRALPPPPRLRPEVARLPAVGAHEVLIEGPRHGIDWPELGAPALALVLRTARDRVRGMAGRGYSHVSLFRNHGPMAGASIDHPHMQLVGLEWVPARSRHRARELRRLAERLGTCPVCARVASELESPGERIVLTTPTHVACVPWAPELSGEVWILPRSHQTCFAELADAELEALAGMLVRVRALQRDAFRGASWNAIFEWAGPPPPGPGGGVHWWVRLVPRLTRIAGFELETGMRVVDSAPEDAAARMRAGLARVCRVCRV